MPVDCLPGSNVGGRLEQLERIFKEVGNELHRSLFCPPYSPRKSKLCQGTLNPFSGKESMSWLGIPSVPSGHSGQWGVAVSCPAAQQRVDKQLKYDDEQPGLIQATVCNSLAGPILDFL